MKRRLLALLATLLIVSGCSSNSISIPDLRDVEEDSAKRILTSQPLIPNIEYEYNDDISEGDVIRTEPEASEMVEKNSTVKVFVSKGPAVIQSLDSSISWYHVGYKDDDWNFTSPRIEEGFLIIDCDVKFGSRLSWYDPKNDGKGFGRASINDKFDKTVPVQIISEKMSYVVGEKATFTLKVPILDLDNQRPTTLFLELYSNVNREPNMDDYNKKVEINFSISWPG